MCSCRPEYLDVSPDEKLRPGRISIGEHKTEVCVCVCVHVCVCVCVCVLAFVRAFVRACVRARLHACVSA